MRVFGTHIRSSPDGAVTVEFKGQDSEFVSVTMARANEILDSDHTVLRAEDIMVHLTAFDDPGVTGQQRGDFTF